MTEAAILQATTRPVEAWLDRQDARRTSAVLQFAAAEKSVVISYLYAASLGMDVPIDEWERFVLSHWKKLDHRAILETEIMALHGDIGELRRLVETGGIRAGDAPTKISYLSKELRGHIEHLAKDMAVHDRRALLLGGVEVVSKVLRKVFGTDRNVWPAIEAAIEAAWAEIEIKNGPK